MNQDKIWVNKLISQINNLKKKRNTHEINSMTPKPTTIKSRKFFFFLNLSQWIEEIKVGMEIVVQHNSACFPNKNRPANTKSRIDSKPKRIWNDKHHSSNRLNIDTIKHLIPICLSYNPRIYCHKNKEHNH